jgi:FdhD protein
LWFTLSSIVTFPIKQFQQSEDQQWSIHSLNDHIISEEPLEIWFKILSSNPNTAQRLSTLMRTPGDDVNLVKGWLYTSGVIDTFSQIHAIHHTGQGRLKKGVSNQILVTLVAGSSVDMTQQQRHEYVNSACGVCGQQSIDQLLSRIESKPANPTGAFIPLPFSAIPGIAEKLVSQQPFFKQTGGNHGVALFDSAQNIIDVREDIGRHNALDKVIGANASALLNQKNTNEIKPIGLILSGRVGFEMIQKAALTNISYVLAFGAPSSLAIQLAAECDIALVGFIKNRGFNVYCNEQLLGV